MDDLDEPTLPPLQLPVPELDIAPIRLDRVADGTRTKLGAAPPPIPTRAKATIPPPIPAKAKAARGRTTMPPPIPAAALAARPRGTASMVAISAAPSDSVIVDPLIAPPPPAAADADIDVPISEEPSVALPPLPRPSRNWLAATTQPPPARVDSPRRSVAHVVVAPPLTGAVVDRPPVDDVTPLPPPAPPADSGEQWPVLTRNETSAVADLFAPAAPEPAAEPDLFASPEAAQVAQAAIEEPDTSYFDRPHTASFNKRHLTAVGAAAVVIAVVAAVVVRGQLSKPSPTKTATPPAIAHVAPTPTVLPSPTPAPAPVEVAVAPTPVVATPAATHTIDIPVTSVPSGAIVTLISNGTPKVLGHTPLFASVDPAQTYDLVVAMSGHPTTMQHLDPHTTTQVAVAFDGSTPVTAPAPAPASAPAPAPVQTVAADAAAPVHHHHHSTPRVAAADSAPMPQIATPKWNVAPAAKPVVAEPPGAANGILMVASKPPCEIVIDGKPTHLETPQRTIALAAGQHAVTLINAKLHINKTVPVVVAAKKPTKLIQDFTH